MVLKALRKSKDGIYLLVVLFAFGILFFASFIYYAETNWCLKATDGIWYYTKGKKVGESCVFQVSRCFLKLVYRWCLLVGYCDHDVLLLF